MTPDERELRRALEARSGDVSPEFRTRLARSLEGGRPGAGSTQLIALAAVIVLSVAAIGILVMARNAGRISHDGPASAARLLSPAPGQVFLPQTAQLSAASTDAVWVYFAQGFLFRSRDRGETWEQRTLPVSLPGESPEISFVDAQNGWLSPSGSPEIQCSAQGSAIWRTSDGGATWKTLAATGIGSAQCKTSLSFVDTQHGFLAAGGENRQPTIYRTSDGGRTWKGSTLPDPSGFVTQAGGFPLLAGGVREFGSTLLVPAWAMNSTTHQFDGYVFRSSDGGASWHVAAKIPAPATSIAIVTAGRWLQLIEPGQSSETTDSGQSWHAYPTDYAQAASVAPQTTFASPLVGYATVLGSIQRTTDGGSHWVLIKTPGI